MNIVRFWVRRHVLGSLHEWCEGHAVELARFDQKQAQAGPRAGLNCAKLVLSNVKEHAAVEEGGLVTARHQQDPQRLPGWAYDS